MKQILFLLAAVLALVSGGARAAAHVAAEEDDTTSSGRAVAVMASTRIEYVPPIRVWFDTAGTLLVCRAPGETYTHASMRCELPGSSDVRVGWRPLPSLTLPGYALYAVQVNETKNGPSLVLYWRAIPAKKP